LAEAPSHGKPVLLYDVRSRGAESYIRLAKEIISRNLPAQEDMAPIEVSSTTQEITEEQPTAVENSLAVVGDSSQEEPAAPSTDEELDKSA
jgi:hypothetical protein